MDVVFGIFCFIGFLGLILGLPITALVKSANARRELGEMRKKQQDLFNIVADLQQHLKNVERKNGAAPSVAAVDTPPFETSPPKEVEPAPVVSVPEPEALIPVPEVSKILETPQIQEQEAPAEIPFPPEPSRAAPPPLSSVIAERHRVEESASPEVPPVAARTAPPPLPSPPVAVPPPIPAAPKKQLNLEQFMGVKLFAWLGGLALFFGVVLFIKYAYDHHLITPAAQVAIGYVIGLGLLGGGIVLTRKASYAVLAQTFCATGILVLYGDTYAAYSFHHLMGAPVAFGIMTLVTATAFFLSIRFNALSISILGMLGGFLTPILCSNGEDNPWALFGYIALLDIGLLAVARVRKWYFLASLGAAGTIIMQLTWFGNFFDRGHYDVGQATWTPILICTVFMVLFLVAAFRTKQNETGNLHPMLSAMALCGSALLFAFLFLDYSNITSRTWLLYGFVLLINAGVIAGIIINPRLGLAQLIIGLATFLHLAVWTTHQLSKDELGNALAVYFLFGLLHSVFPIVWQRLRPQNTYALQGAFSPWFPPLTILLMLLPVVSMPEVSFILWPAVLLADALAIVVAVTTKRLPAVMAALVLTLIVAGVWLFKVPNDPASVPSFLAVVAGFAVFFAIAGCWLAQRFSIPGQAGGANAQVATMLPVMSAALPFALLIMATQRFSVPSPNAIFGIGLLLALLQLGLAKFSRLTILTMVSLGCMFVLEISWHDPNFKPDARWTAVLWYLGINAVFAVYPFIFRKAFRDTILPWATAALALGLQYLLVHRVVRENFPDMAHIMGLLPALYAVPALLSLFAVLRGLDSTGKTREAQLAWFGGVSLFFITLIFPTQLGNQWLTISWALEGTALLWLFQRVPHQGLRGTGLFLLGTAFVRLALNPDVLIYETHSTTPILNWYFYTYGLSAVAMFLGARLLKEPNHRFFGLPARGILWTFGGILLFWLLNIEIADFFTPANSQYTVVEFRNNDLARDMTYSITWGIFALALILLGFLFHTRGARYAGISLMALTLLKVFLHDLATLESIYRIGALIGVAVVALAASFLYQRFFDRTNETTPPSKPDAS